GLVAVPLIFSMISVLKLSIIKGQMSEALRSEKLQTISVAGKDLEWIVPGKEILIGGHLFDVDSYRYLDNKVEITGLYDREEDNLQDHIANMFHQKETGNSTDNAVLLNLFFHTLFIEKNI